MKKEIELKFRLSCAKDLNCFMDFISPLKTASPAVYKQTNYYFDTKDFHLKKHKLSLRLRKQNDLYSLCAKGAMAKEKTSDNLSVRLEFEQNITTNKALLLLSNKLSALEMFLALSPKDKQEEATHEALKKQLSLINKKINLVGSFNNNRTAIPIAISEHKINIECDHTIFPKNIETFEIESEFSNIGEALTIKQIFKQLFKEAGIKTYNSSSKSSRLFKILSYK